MPFAHREAWLHAASETLAQWLEKIDVDTPQLRISCGWSKRAGKAIGWCWHRETATDKVNQIYVSPEIDDAVQVLGVLLHEMIHASDNGKSKHSGHFRKTALAIGLSGRMTATMPGEKLAARLKELADDLGPYPHAKIQPGTRMAKQGTRLLKVECPCCGYTIRVTSKWLANGTPFCPSGTQMEEVV